MATSALQIASSRQHPVFLLFNLQAGVSLELSLKPAALL